MYHAMSPTCRYPLLDCLEGVYLNPSPYAIVLEWSMLSRVGILHWKIYLKLRWFANPTMHSMKIGVSWPPRFVVLRATAVVIYRASNRPSAGSRVW